MSEEDTGLSFEEIQRILDLVERSSYGELRLETGTTRLYVRKVGEPMTSALGDRLSVSASGEAPVEQARGVGAPPEQPGESPSSEPPGGQPGGVLESERGDAPPAQPEAAADDEAPGGLQAVKAPMVGTFYRAPSPGAPPFVEVGDQVEATDDVCLIEVMKLFNSIPAGVAGTVREIVAENGATVEYGEPMLFIEPQAG